jgi:outer membrane lipoprotein-sorting protein
MIKRVLFKQRTVKVLLFMVLSLSVMSSLGSAQESFDAEAWLLRAEMMLSGVENYTAIFHKQELIKGKLTREETILFKFKKPLKVYMKWIKDPYYGRESLYVEGCNNNRIKVHECGLLGIMNVNLDPGSSLVMEGSRHPITDSGIENTIKVISKNIIRSMKTKGVTIKERGEEVVYGRKTRKIELLLPESKTKGYYCYRSVINIDLENDIPIKVMIFDWDGILIESYGYEALKLNAGLTDADFDPHNPAYRF